MDRSSATTVARFIRRFRDSQPLSREDRRKEREALEGDIWWTRPHEGTFSGSTPAQESRTEIVEERKPPEHEDPAFFSDPHREDHETVQEDPGHVSESDDLEDGPQTADQTPALAISLTPDVSSPRHPLRSTAPSRAFESDRKALDLVNDVSGMVSAAAVEGTMDGGERSERDHHSSSEKCVTAATFSPNLCTDPYERGGDELAALDARARTLLEDCRRVLDPPSSASDKELIHQELILASEEGTIVGACNDSRGSSSIEGLEERAWMLLNNHEEREAHPGNIFSTRSYEPAESLEARNGLAGLPCARESSLYRDSGETRMLTPQHKECWRFAGEPLAEGENMYPCQQGFGCERAASAETRKSGNVDLDSAFDEHSARKDSLLDVHTGSISTMGSASSGARRLSAMVLAASAAEAECFRKDPILSALLQRFGEIESELDRRSSPEREDESGGNWGR